MNDKLVIIGNPTETHVGSHLYDAALELGLPVKLYDTKWAYRCFKLIAKINWHFRSHRPTNLGAFSRDVVRACHEFRPKWMLATGLVPIESSALTEIGKSGIKRLNYMTDDPWNPLHRADWFMKALTEYDSIFSTRRSNIEDLRCLGCKRVSYLPFAYSPKLHFPEHPNTDEEKSRLNYDVLFIGGADRDRISYISALIKAGFKVGLYGGYWERFRETKKESHGHANPQELRKAITASKVTLCLVRRANRDGNSMRTFEIPAMAGCMLTEDTKEHREIFDEEGKHVVYFKDINAMIKKIKFLLDNETERKRLARSAHTFIVNGKHTYRHRLLTMLEEF